MSSEFQLGPWGVQPDQNSISRNGKTTRLEPKMVEVLVCLAEQPGETVSKEQLIRKVWGNTFVTDDVLTRCISELRRALEDEPKQPQFIETIPRKGYRLRSKVQLTKQPWKRHWKALIAMPLVLLSAASVGIFLGRRPPLTERDTILVADFANHTGDSIFDNTLRPALTIQLAQSPFLSIFPEDDVRETLRYMGHSPDEQVTTSIAREICQRHGIKAVLAGSIASMGRDYVVSLEARNCQSGEPLAQEQVQVQSKEHVLGGLGQAASKLRAKLGESLPSIEKYDAPVEQATTSSLEALRAYSLGQQRLAHGADPWDVVPFFKRAIELDENFAMAYVALGGLYSGSGPMSNDDLSTKYLTTAFNLRNRVSEREKLYVASAYYQAATRQLDRAVESYELWKATYPRDAEPYDDLAGIYIVLGQYQKAAENAQSVIRLRPKQIFGYESLATAYSALNRWSEAKAICDQAVAQKLDGARTHWRLYTIAFIENDLSAMERELEWSKKKGETTRPPFYQALVAAYGGKLKRASALIDQTVEDRLTDHDPQGAALATVQLAVINATVGYRKRAMEEALASERNIPTDRHLLSLALALSGHSARARELVTAVKERFPQDTRLTNIYAPSVYAIIELNRTNAGQALELLKTAGPYELGADSSGWGLLPIYLRGQAYLQKRAGNEAGVEFQKIIDHRGIAPFSPLHALARLGKGRAYALQGETAASKAAYADFFSVWKVADSDLPILKEAKIEYEKLP